MNSKASLPLFSLTKTSPFAWKEGFLAMQGKDLRIFSKKTWHYKLIKWATSSALYDISSLARIRNCISQMAKELQGKNQTLDDIFCANKNITCLNEKIERHNQKVKRSAVIKKVTLLDLPKLIKEPPTFSLSTHFENPEKRFKDILKPAQEYPPKIRKLEKWVSKQHASLQPLAYRMATSLTENYISFGKFVWHLDISYTQALKAIKNAPFGHISWQTSRNSSGPWVESLLKNQRKPKMRIGLHNIKKTVSCESKMVWSQNTKKTKRSQGKALIKKTALSLSDWILCDDVAFSGQQLVEYILPEIEKTLKGLGKEKRFSLHLVVPFMTDYTVKRLTALKEHFESFSLYIYPSYIMPTVDQINTHLSPEDRTMGALLIGPSAVTTKEKMPLPTVTYFAHKHEEGAAFLSALGDGKIIDYNYNNIPTLAAFDPQSTATTVKRYTRCIPKIIPPYRS